MQEASGKVPLSGDGPVFRHAVASAFEPGAELLWIRGDHAGNTSIIVRRAALSLTLTNRHAHRRSLTKVYSVSVAYALRCARVVKPGRR